MQNICCQKNINKPTEINAQVIIIGNLKQAITLKCKFESWIVSRYRNVRTKVKIDIEERV
jgi:hypothetical protein